LLVFSIICPGQAPDRRRILLPAVWCSITAGEHAVVIVEQAGVCLRDQVAVVDTKLESIMTANEPGLNPETRIRVIETKITCPFLGSAANQAKLTILGEVDNPLARIEDVRKLGNTGGGDLGDLLVLFAEGNHAFMRGGSGVVLDMPVPPGMFSLELPGSQGSHPGHSGILQGDPRKLDSGRLSVQDFDRLAALARGGLIKRADVGRFIAENLKRDAASKVTGAGVAKLLFEDLGGLLGAAGGLLIGLVQSDGAGANLRKLEEKLTKLMGEDNLVGSSGEFGLLFAFLGRSPRAGALDGELALSFADVRTMFLDKCLPEGWELWSKTRVDWVVHTASLIVSAATEFSND
jgi:hypothetical protein